MSLLNRNNQREKSAYVSLLATEGTSKIEVLQGDIKEIRVYISTNSITPTLQSYRHSLLQLFLHLIEGHRIPHLESNNEVSPDIVRLFINVCSQVDSGKPIRSIVDDTGRPIITSESRVTVFASENRLVAEADERLAMQETTRRQQEAEQTRRQQEAEQTRRQQEAEQTRRQQEESQRNVQLQYETEYQRQQQQQRRQIQESARRGINELFGLLTPDGNNEEKVGQVLTEVGQILSGNVRPSTTDYVRATADRRRQNSNQSNSFNPLNPFNPFMLFGSPSPIVDALPFPINLMTPRQTTEDSPFLEPIRNLSDPQPNPPSNLQNPSNRQSNQPLNRPTPSNQSEESEVPSRFVENHIGARREIIPDEKNNMSIVQPMETKQTTEPIVHPNHLVPVRKPVPLDLIQKIASNIHDLIKNGKTRPPDFTSKTKSSMNKIKNYIHNVSRTWLSQSEIELFVAELTKLQSTM